MIPLFLLREDKTWSAIPADYRISYLTLNRYSSYSSGPYLVQIEKCVSQDSVQSIDSKRVGVIGLTAALFKLADFPEFLSVASDFKRSYNNRFCLAFPTAKNANDFVAECGAVEDLFIKMNYGSLLFLIIKFLKGCS